VAAYCSERERESMKIERSADDICAAFLLERELAAGDREKSLAGEVSGLIRSGAFVAFGGELGDVYEGFLPARRLRGDGEFLELNESETALVGKGSGRRVRMGDPIVVRVTGIEAARGRVDLEPAPAAAES
jgi:exoribonuclease R